MTQENETREEAMACPLCPPEESDVLRQRQSSRTGGAWFRFMCGTCCFSGAEQASEERAIHYWNALCRKLAAHDALVRVAREADGFVTPVSVNEDPGRRFDDLCAALAALPPNILDEKGVAG